MDPVEDLLASLTLEAKVAQLVGFMPIGITGQDEDADRELLRKALPHGVGCLSAILEMASNDPDSTARKVAAVQRYLVEETPGGIPALVHAEALNGFVYAGAVHFPTPIGIASTFRPEHAHVAATVAARQMSALGIQHAFSPVLDVARDPRFGRVHETYGEDPQLCAAFGIAAVGALQAGGVLATGKHFLAYSASEAALNMANVDLGERALRETYAVPFEAAIRDAGLFSIMNSYSSVDGVPVAVSHAVLTGLLRDELGFEGVVVSDYGSIPHVKGRHGVGRDLADVAVRALVAGLDVELPTMVAFETLETAVADGRLDEAVIDRAVRRVLRAKARAGLLDPAGFQPRTERYPATADDHDAALTAAVESIVLLRNEPAVLPLTPGKVAVIGPFAERLRPLYAAYSGPAGWELLRYSREVGSMEGVAGDIGDVEGAIRGRERGIPEDELEDAILRMHPEARSVAAALAATAPSGATVRSARGCDHLATGTSDLDEAVALAAQSDVAVCVIGEKTGWAGDATAGEGRDRASLDLLGDQRQLVEAVAATGTPIVAVLLCGRPLDLAWLDDVAAAIVVAWHPGTLGGDAIASVLWGDAAPGGKLPITFPRSVGHVPTYAGHRVGSGYRGADGGPAEHSHIDGPDTPRYAFGHGLSYTQFEISPLTVLDHEIAAGEEIRATVTVTNVGDRRGDEVVQLYAHDLDASVARPVRQLVGFRRVSLDPGEARRLDIAIDTRVLALWSTDRRWVVEPGPVRLVVARASDDELDGVDIELTGPELELPHRVAWLGTVTEAEAELALERGDDRAEVCVTGAGLRALHLAGIDVLAPAPQGAAAQAEYWGSVLAPWPNRLADGRFTHAGREYQLPVNDTAFGAALHGLVGAMPFLVTERTPSSVTLAACCGDPDYPSRLRVSVRYTLTDRGLDAHVEARNVGSASAPAGLGVHPYLAPGGAVDEASLTVPAATQITPDARLLPAGVADRGDGANGSVALRGVELDTTYGDLVADGDGHVTATLRRADGRSVEVWAGETCRWIQAYTADTLPVPRTRTAVAIEPMTCAADALNTGQDLVVLEPGESLDLAWGVRVADA